MIVIVIIGVVYTLAITQLKGVEEKKMHPSFLNLKEYLLSFATEDAERVNLICLDDCAKCGVYVDGEKVHEIESFFDENVEIYKYNFLEGMRRAQKAVYFNEENLQQDLCFSFNVDKNGISEQLFVRYDEKVYDYTSYLTKTQRYDSLEEATRVHEENIERVLR